MNAATRTTMDEPGATAVKILQAIESDRKEGYLGFPESLFARLNRVWPGLVDAATRAQNRVARPFAKR